MREKHFVYLIEDGTIVFYKGTFHDYEGVAGPSTVWSPDPKDAYDFPGIEWVAAQPTKEMPHRKEKGVSPGEEFARKNGARFCIGDPRALLKLHERGPRIGQRVRVLGNRSDGHVYGTGQVVGYAEYLPHFLSHTVALDHPPKAGAPDERGRVLTRDPEVLAEHDCPASELEILKA